MNHSPHHNNSTTWSQTTKNIGIVRYFPCEHVTIATTVRRNADIQHGDWASFTMTVRVGAPFLHNTCSHPWMIHWDVSFEGNTIGLATYHFAISVKDATTTTTNLTQRTLVGATTMMLWRNLCRSVRMTTKLRNIGYCMRPTDRL
jgi:hypothetical protein